MDDKHFINSHPVELLAVTVGRVSGEPKVILTIRHDSAHSFEPLNLALSPEQAFRLMQDLASQFQESEWLKDEASMPPRWPWSNVSEMWADILGTMPGGIPEVEIPDLDLDGDSTEE